MTPRREEIVSLSFVDLEHQLQTGAITAVEALQAFQAKALGKVLTWVWVGFFLIFI